MGLGFKKSALSGGSRPIWQGRGEDMQLVQGGFLLDTAGLTADAVVEGGTPVNYDEVTRVVKVLKTAKVYEATSTSAVKVYKGHLLTTSDNLGAVVGGAAYAISTIDTSNSAYDLVTLSTALGALTAGQALFASSASGAAAAAYVVQPNGLLYAEMKVEENESASVAIRGTIYERRVPAVTAAIKELLPHIIYSKSL